MSRPEPRGTAPYICHDCGHQQERLIECANCGCFDLWSTEFILRMHAMLRSDKSVGMPATTNPPKPLIPWSTALGTIWLTEELAATLEAISADGRTWTSFQFNGVMCRPVLACLEGRLQLGAEPV